MVDIRPFKGWFCNTKQINADQFISPPYDKISESLAEELYTREHNFIHLILGQKNPRDSQTYNRYTRARDLLDDWTRGGQLVTSGCPCVYLYQQDFEYAGRAIQRSGLISLLKIEDLGKGSVFGHERTLSHPKVDRYQLLKTTQANFGQIFMLYDDTECQIEKIYDRYRTDTPLIQATDELQIKHSIWAISDAAEIDAIQKVLQDKSIVIADGHHRYETSVMYRDEQRQKNGGISEELPSDFTMVTLVNTYDENLLVLPTHRLVRDVTVTFEDFCESLKGHFEICGEWSLEDKEVSESIKLYLESHVSEHVFVVCHEGARKAVSIRMTRESQAKLPSEISCLDVSILHSQILDRILGINEEVLREGSRVSYVRDIAEGIKKITDSTYQYLFCMNAPNVHDVSRIARSGERMPQKSTDFYPKFYSGLIFRKM